MAAHNITQILDRSLDGGRVSPQEAAALLECNDLPALADAADAARMRLHGRTTTYVIDRNINYTNVCCSRCRFCAFYRHEGSPSAYVLSHDELARKIEETLALGGTRILLQGGLHPTKKLDFYTDMLRRIKCRYHIRVHGFSPPEIIHFAGLASLDAAEVLRRLIDAGLDSLPGGGAEILDDEIRRNVSPGKCTADEWISVMRAAHDLGLPTTATMVIGLGEKTRHRINHLARIRDLQDRTGGFTNFIPWTFQPTNTKLGGRPPGGFEYLRMLAVSRIFLDNIPTVQASWVTQGKAVAQAALRFGANDFGSTMIEENVVRAAGVTYRISLEEILEAIRTAGFEPRQRAG
ncbi:MAG: dehypoxanthine futalosine cyclase [Planctomycetes bacterium]|nr:dehypoxanthine futalosine cyclase [Planctomycetota bacterium]